MFAEPRKKMLQSLEVINNGLCRMFENVCAGSEMFADSQSMACEGEFFVIGRSTGRIAVKRDI